MDQTIKGLIIRETSFSDNDRYITVLTEKIGKISVLCKGVRRKKNSFSASIRLFCYSELVLHENKGKFILIDAQTISSFWNITADIEKYALACYFSQLIDCTIGDFEEEKSEYLRLFLIALYSLTEKNRPISLVKAVFEMRLATIEGFMPDISSCKRCSGNAEYFSVENGNVLCGKCGKNSSYIRIQNGVLDAIRFITSADVKKIFSFIIGNENLLVLSKVCEAYVIYHWARTFDTLDFYKSLLVTEQ